MADIIDVQNALVGLAAQVVYPNGTSQPSAITSPVKLYAGWPTQSQLDADLLVGTAHMTVFPLGIERNTTRFPSDWQQSTINQPTLTLVVNGQQITVAGSLPATYFQQNIAVFVGYFPYVYAVQPGDTLNSIATALSALIPGATSSGATITVSPGALVTAARVGGTGTSVSEIRRQERQFQLTAWANSPQARDALASLVDVALAQLRFISLPDGTAGRLIYRHSNVIDALQKSRLYRRDLVYSVEYGTTLTANNSQIVVEQLNVSTQVDGALSANPVVTTYQ